MGARSADVVTLPSPAPNTRVSISRVYFNSAAERTMLELAKREQETGALVAITQAYESGHGHYTEIIIVRGPQ